MSEAKLDQIVKGAPQADISLASLISRTPTPSPSENPEEKPSSGFPIYTSSPSDPTSTLPSSPPQIYLNLLILEASLRAQYVTLRARRRQNTFFLLILAAWTAYFAYALFLRPREDGSGMGGSVYWMVELAEKLALLGGVVTGILIWGTGQWERGVRWPRRWVGVTNRGLRVMNMKIVVIRGPWWREMLSHLTFLFPFPILRRSRSSYRHVEHALSKGSHGGSLPGHAVNDRLQDEEDLEPGGDHIKLLLLPKPFSPDFRENWELYRAEYWEKENERRMRLRKLIRKEIKEWSKEQGGWLWWASWPGRTYGKAGDVERTHRHHLSEKDARRAAGTNGPPHSRSGSRASVRSHNSADIKLTSDRVRRGSSTSSIGDRQKRPKGVASTASLGPPKLTRLSSRTETPSLARIYAGTALENDTE